MRAGTVCYVLKGSPPQEILLGMKKLGMGEGKYNGFGGKIEVGETPAEAAARELEEESGLKVTLADLDAMGHVDFLHDDERMHVFVVFDWTGVPQESDEMVPSWFGVEQIPYGQMWPTDRNWLPHVLTGRRIEATVNRLPDGEPVCTLNLID